MARQKASTSDVIKLPRVRLSFARLWTPKSFQEGQEPRFEGTFLLDPSKPIHAEKIKELKATAAKLAKEAFGEKIPKDIKLCFGDGNTKDYDGYANMIYIASHSKIRPAVVDRNKNPVAEGDPQAPYSGCIVNATVTLWLQDNKWGKRVNCNLRGVQFVEDGPAFGIQPVDADEEFEAMEDGGSAGGEDDIGF